MARVIADNNRNALILESQGILSTAQKKSVDCSELGVLDTAQRAGLMSSILKSGEVREVLQADSTGRKLSHFYGNVDGADLPWIAPFTAPVRLVTNINTPRGAAAAARGWWAK